MKNNKIDALNGQSAALIKHYIKIFEGMTLQDAEDIRRRH
jgi:hypothetical protein